MLKTRINCTDCAGLNRSTILNITLLLRKKKFYLNPFDTLSGGSCCCPANFNTSHLAFTNVPNTDDLWGGGASVGASVRDKLRPAVIRGPISGQTLMLSGSPALVDVITVARR